METEIGKTKRVFLSKNKYALVTWFGYGSNSVQIKEFEVAELQCPPSYLDDDVEGNALGSVGLRLRLDELALAEDINIGQPTKYIVFIDSLENEFTPSEVTPFGFGRLQKYKFDVSDIKKENAIIFKAYKTDLETKDNVEVDLPIELGSNSVQVVETDGYYGGDLIVGPISEDTEWIQYEFADKTEIANIAEGRHFQYAKKCNYIPPEPTPTPTPTETPSPTITPTPTPYFYSGDYFSVLYKDVGSSNYQRYGQEIKCSDNGDKFIILSNPFKTGGFVHELEFYEIVNQKITKLNQTLQSSDAENNMTSIEISGDGNNVIYGKPNYTVSKNIDSQTESVPYLGQLWLNTYNSSYKKYNIITKINTTENTPFLRFGTETKISKTGRVVVGFVSSLGVNHYEVCVKSSVNNRYENFVVNSSTLASFSDKKLSKHYTLTNDGNFLFVALKSENFIVGINTTGNVISRVINLPINSDSITNLETNQDGTTLLISTNNTLYIYAKNELDDGYTLLFESQTSDFIGTMYKLNSDGRRIVIARPAWNNERG